MKLMNYFQTTGSLRAGAAWRGDQTILTPENVERVHQAVEVIPHYSEVSSLHPEDVRQASSENHAPYINNFYPNKTSV